MVSRHNEPTAQGPTPSDRFDRLATAWLAGLTAERTRAAYRGDLDRFRSWLEDRGVASPLEASSRDIGRFRATLESHGEAGSTMARRMSALRSFYRFLSSRGEITTSPAIAWRAAAAPDPKAGLDADSVAGVRNAAGRLGSRTATLVGLLLFNGMRLDEVLGCDVEDVAVRPPSVTITLDRPRGDRTVDVDRWTAAAIRRYLGDRYRGPLLLGESPTRPADRLTRFGADYLIKRAGATAGIELPMSANMLRRTFVSRMHADGMSLHEISERLGHRDVRTTMRHVPSASRGVDGSA